MSFATSLPLLTNLALLLGLSLFFGLAFEEFQAKQGRTRNPRRSLFVNSDHRGASTPCQHR